jgi:hypothetical protein
MLREMPTCINLSLYMYIVIRILLCIIQRSAKYRGGKFRLRLATLCRRRQLQFPPVSTGCIEKEKTHVILGCDQCLKDQAKGLIKSCFLQNIELLLYAPLIIL